MAPPTIANGRVYLASFGTENVGTGRFCVYGLLPKKNAEPLAAPTGVKALVQDGRVTLTWNRVHGGRIYRVFERSTSASGTKPVALGLTTPTFTAPETERDEPVAYTVVAVGNNGAGRTSDAVTIGAAKIRMKH